jgi:hypothetical protein
MEHLRTCERQSFGAMHAVRGSPFGFRGNRPIAPLGPNRVGQWTILLQKVCYIGSVFAKTAIGAELVGIGLSAPDDQAAIRVRRGAVEACLAT